MKRFVFSLSLLTSAGLVASGLSGCTSTVGYAAKVNGAVISRTEVDQELADISRNKDYVARIDQGAPGPLEGATKGTYNKGFVAVLLNQQIKFAIIHQLLAGAKALPSSGQVETARSEITQQFTKAIYDNFPVRYKNLLVAQQADADAFIKTIPGGDASDAAVTRYYRSHLNDYATEACVRHILIADKGTNGQIDYSASLTDANKVLAQLTTGADFATLAKAVSKDNAGTGGGSAAQGGAITGSATDGCMTSQDLQTLIAPFALAVSSLPVNKVSDPVKTTFGYHLIQITSRVTAPLDDTVRSDIQQRLAVERLNQVLKVATVRVNPEFGTFSPQVAANGQITGVMPPLVPGAATTTTTPAAG